MHRHVVTYYCAPVLVAFQLLVSFTFNDATFDVSGGDRAGQYQGVVYREPTDSEEIRSNIHASSILDKADLPNIVLVLTDDQDLTLGGMTPMEKTKKLIGDSGATFNNMFVTTPICCPSRSSILTGQYQHNHRVLNNSLPGNCNGESWRSVSERTHAFAPYLKSAGYSTFYAGKYLNQYGHKQAGGIEHVPPGWDHWVGLVGNSRYYNYSLSVHGVEETHGDDPDKDYLTNVIKTKALEFLESFDPSKNGPLMMMIATPAPHAPYTPEPKYKDAFSFARALRTPNFNIKVGKDKHWLLQHGVSPLPQDVIDTVDEYFRDRWRSLLSVDDLVSSVHQALTDKGMLNNTFFIYTSDHGYHLGQFSQPIDKRQPYEFDIRVPLLVSGPGVENGSNKEDVVLNIDLAPTILDMAGIKPLDTMDGESFLPSLIGSRRARRQSRNLLFVEYHGETDHSEATEACTHDPNMAGCRSDLACKCQDARNNTYQCIRNFDAHQDFIYCEFDDNEIFTEFYDIRHDPYQLVNQAGLLQSDWKQHLKQLLPTLAKCAGKACRDLERTSFDHKKS